MPLIIRRRQTCCVMLEAKIPNVLASTALPYAQVSCREISSRAVKLVRNANIANTASLFACTAPSSRAVYFHVRAPNPPPADSAILTLRVIELLQLGERDMVSTGAAKWYTSDDGRTIYTILGLPSQTMRYCQNYFLCSRRARTTQSEHCEVVKLALGKRELAQKDQGTRSHSFSHSSM